MHKAVRAHRALYLVYFRIKACRKTRASCIYAPGARLHAQETLPSRYAAVLPVQSLARDGTVYFGGIFCVNFIWVMMILTARPTLHGALQRHHHRPRHAHNHKLAPSYTGTSTPQRAHRRRCPAVLDEFTAHRGEAREAYDAVCAEPVSRGELEREWAAHVVGCGQAVVTE
ncbi:hypothetical protein FA95DRAFT_323791 [Auriscalpium vulgare]|uniref:Uncharacterized protein n=1 Tax=Auriscalpium vulgare TaxID=40419 RepID=A0ACB8RIY1_9AGAM|nr:hypothetical protein FA95DRAFT_323791 [Auriscalpium vulgare]